MTREVRAFIEKVNDDRKPFLKELHSLILSLYPDARDSITYGIPKLATETGNVWIGYWKGGVSLYTGLPSVIAEFKKKHPSIKVGRGCINFKTGEKIPFADVKKIIKIAMEQKKKK
jgi:uncharacterized protein YdhG (YjbR/CyaY superfamily)